MRNWVKCVQCWVEDHRNSISVTAIAVMLGVMGRVEYMMENLPSWWEAVLFLVAAVMGAWALFSKEKEKESAATQLLANVDWERNPSSRGPVRLNKQRG